MPHGGRRPGAGAPPGNANAMKDGFYSRNGRIANGTVTDEDITVRLRMAKTAAALGNTSAAFEMIRTVFRAVERRIQDHPAQAEKLRSEYKSLLADRSEAWWKAIQRYDRANSIKQSKEKYAGPPIEPIMDLIGRVLLGRPRPITPGAQAWKDYTGSHCPLVMCCLVFHRPCEFDRPFATPHPFHTWWYEEHK